MRALLLMLLVPAIAFGQGLNPSPPGGGQKRTNYLVQSGISADNALVSPWASYAGNTIVTSGEWTKITNTGALSVVYQNTSGMPSSTQFMLSVSVRTDDVGAATLKAACSGGAPVLAATCTRSDGVACSPTTPGTGGVPEVEARLASVPTSAIRVSMLVTCRDPATTFSFQLNSSDMVASGHSAYFSEPQLELGVIKPSKYCATTTAVRTCKN